MKGKVNQVDYNRTKLLNQKTLSLSLSLSLSLYLSLSLSLRCAWESKKEAAEMMADGGDAMAAPSF